MPGIRVIMASLAVLYVGTAFAQVAATPASPTSSSSGFTYVVPSMLPTPAQAYLNALGNRLVTPGQERTTLVGTYTDNTGTHPAQLVWQVPGSIRFDLLDGSTSLIYSYGTGLVNASQMSGAQSDVLESLLDDSMETFLYGFVQGAGHRYLGGNFRADGGDLPNYQGPWYGIYGELAAAKAQPGNPLRSKFFYFDSLSGLLVKTEYETGTDSAGTSITTQFSNWMTTAGQAFPGQITRTENGATVFTFKINSAVVTPAVNDGLFTGN